MHDATSFILGINGGSSSIKFVVFETETLTPVCTGKVDRIDMEGTYITYTDTQSGVHVRYEIATKNPITCIAEMLTERMPYLQLAAIGHRIVFGGTKYTGPTRINTAVIANLKEFSSFAPRHLPAQIELLEAFMTHFPNVTQCACFDTSFYRTMPRMAEIIPIPRKYEAYGVRRYGFHGLSYEYLMYHLDTVRHEPTAKRKVLLVHLGSGSSLTAVEHGIPVDTSMGFSPASGLPMGTRSGDLDPGLFDFFVRTLDVTPEAFNHMVNFESGLLGISETTADMEVLIQNEATDPQAAEAVSFFCYQVAKQIGALTAALGGINALVFTGGIGEQSPIIRSRICTHIAHLGIELDDDANAENNERISVMSSDVAVFMIPTNEELMIAQHTKALCIS